MAAREWLAIIEESAFNTPLALGSQTVGTNVFYIRLDGGNAFSMRPTPVMVSVPYGGGYAVDAFRVSDKTELKGRLTTKLYTGAFSSFLLSWAGQRINTGQTAPWTTTEPAGDLASCAITHAIQVGSSYFVRNYSGVKVEGYDFEVSESGQIATLSLDLVASTPNPAIPGGSQPSWAASAPTDVQLPGPQGTGGGSVPFLFTNAGTGGGGTGLIVANSGTARPTFQSVKISSKNVIARRFWANQYVQVMRWCGRSTSLVAENWYTNSPDDRIGYEAVTVQTPVSFQLYNSATAAITWNFETNSVFTSITDQLPLNDLYLQTMTVQNQWDAANSADYTLTLLPATF